MTIDQSLLPKEKRAIHPRNRDRDELDRQEHATHDGFGCGRRQDEMHPQKLWFLSRRSLPRRKQEGQDQKHDHPIKDGDIQLL